MDKVTKIWLIIAVSLVLIGCALFAVTMSNLSWNFTKLSTDHYETNTYKIQDDFNNIHMETDTADIVFTLSGDGNCRVECYEEENAKHTVTVKDGTLTIKLIDERTVSDYIGYIGIHYDTPKITVYLPEYQYTSLFIEEDTGDIEIPKDFQFETVEIKVSTGDVKVFASASEWMQIETNTGDLQVTDSVVGSLALSVSTGRMTVSQVDCPGEILLKISTGKTNLTDVTCERLLSRGGTGDIYLENVIVDKIFSIARGTGDVTFERCDAGEVFIQTDTGDVRGSFLTEKVFITETDTGHVNVPKSANGGRCEISTDTGDIRIEIG